MDWDLFDERVAICMADGASQYEAETIASRDQGFERFEVKHEISKRNLEHERHHRSIYEWHPTHHLPRVQSAPAKEERPVPERHVYCR